MLNEEQKKTLNRLAIVGLLMCAAIIAALWTEVKAIEQGHGSTISELFWIAWANEPGAVLAIILTLVVPLSILLGHFVWQRKSTYEDIRRRGAGYLLLLALPLAACGGIKLQGDELLRVCEGCRAAPATPVCAQVLKVCPAEPAPTPAPTPQPSPSATPAPQPTPTPTPKPAPSCVPQDVENNELWSGMGDREATRLTDVQEALDALRRERPDLVSDRGLRNWSADPDRQHALATEFFVAMGAILNRSGICAGPFVDALAVNAHDDVWEEYHLLYYLSGEFLNVTNAYRGSWAYGPREIVITPNPLLRVCGPPTPPPLAKFNVKEHGAFCANLDSTAIVRGRDYCEAIGFTDGRGECPLRQEGAPDREACEALLVGTPKWSVEGEGCSIYSCAVPGNCQCGDGTRTVNPFRATVTGKGCTVTVCDGIAGTACGTVQLEGR